MPAKPKTQSSSQGADTTATETASQMRSRIEKDLKEQAKTGDLRKYLLQQMVSTHFDTDPTKHGESLKKLMAAIDALTDAAKAIQDQSGKGSESVISIRIIFQRWVKALGIVGDGKSKVTVGDPEASKKRQDAVTAIIKAVDQIRDQLSVFTGAESILQAQMDMAIQQYTREVQEEAQRKADADKAKAAKDAQKAGLSKTGTEG